jgi:hypothetical protein
VDFRGTTGASRNPAASIHQTTNPNPSINNPIIPEARGVNHRAVVDGPPIPTKRQARQAAPRAIKTSEGLTDITHGPLFDLLVRRVYVRLATGRDLEERLDGDVRLTVATRFRFLTPDLPPTPSLLRLSKGQTHTFPWRSRRTHHQCA